MGAGFAKRASRLGLGLALVVLVGGCVHANTTLSGNWPGFQTDSDTIQIISAVIGEKNVFIPSTIVVTDGVPAKLSVYNTTGKPHGFAIAGLGIQEVLMPDVEFEIALPPLQAGMIYRIHCQLHPPHRGATLVVLRSP